MDTRVSVLEEKEALSEMDKAFVSQLEKKLERLDDQHRKLHIAVLDSINQDEDGSIELKKQKEYGRYEDTVKDV